MSDSPKHHINLRATVTPMDEMSVELEWDKISNYYTHDNNSADSDGMAERPGIFNLRLSYDRGPYEFWAHARNLRNTRYAEGVSYSTRSGGSRSYTSGEARNAAIGFAYNW